jgi:hypothetical protein
MHIARWARFLRDYCEFKRQAIGSPWPFKFGRFYPCFKDRSKPIEASGHYFHQDLLVANRIFLNNPIKHVDVGSRMDGLVAHVACFREVEVIDIRPLRTTIPNVRFRQADLMSADFRLKDYSDSLSSLHAIEHFGLGRYGDRIDFHGYLTGLDRLYEILKEGGKFYFSVPIGDQRIEFNAHRVFSVQYLLELLEGKYRVDSFSYVNDDGNLVKDPPLDGQDVENSFSCHYGCGIFELTKVRGNVPFIETGRIRMSPCSRTSSIRNIKLPKVIACVANKLIATKHEEAPEAPTRREQELLDDLRETFQKLGVEKVKNAVGPERMWKEQLNRLQRLVLKRNPREFLRWDVIQETMFVANERYIANELNYLKQRPDWNECWRTAIEEVAAGWPIPFNEYPRSSGNLIHHAYHICQLQEVTAANVVTMELVFEFGGGYGSMCRLFHNLGFRGKYIIFDLPHFSALQRYYLQSVGVPVYTFEQLQSAESGVICVSDVEEVKELILDDGERSQPNSLVIATWSISEAPVGLRDEVLSLVSHFQSFLFAYQDSYAGIDNSIYFQKVKDRHQDIEWKHWMIEHLPGNHYLVGGR